MAEGSKSTRLEAAIAQSFARGDNTRALAGLRELASLPAADAEVFHRLAVIEEQIGEAELATRAHLKCLRLAPNNPVAYLYAGYWLARQGRLEEAVALYSLGSDLDPALLAPSSRDDPTGQRLNAANAALRHHFSAAHRNAVGDDPALARIREALWTRTHDQPFSFRLKEQIPQLFYIPGLTPDHFGDTRNWPWVAQLENRAEAIKQEFMAALPHIRELGRPYLDPDMALGEEFRPLLGSLNWTALDLYRDGIRQQELAAHFPQTLEALQCAPLYGLDHHPFEVFFSLLKPGHHIKPHYGLSNHSLTVHLPVIVPPECELVVNGERRQWQEGKIVAFDDSFIHEAVNNSEQERVVLIFSIWQPELSPAERAAIVRSFTTRSQWLEGRTIPPD